MAIEYTEDDKRRFAEAIVKHGGNVNVAAFAAFPGNNALALWAINNWQQDPVVIQARNQLVEMLPDDAKVMSKDVLAQEMLRMANEAFDKDTKLKYYTLFAKLMGYIETGTKVNVNNDNRQYHDNGVQYVLPAKEDKPALIIDTKAYEV